MTQNIIYVALGGAIGSGARYMLSEWIGGKMGGSFPYGTLSVNLIGCLLIGILSAIVSRSQMPMELRLLLMTGFCGGFTTFSTFANESLSMMKTADVAGFLIYTTVSLWIGILAVWTGSKIA